MQSSDIIPASTFKYNILWKDTTFCIFLVSYSISQLLTFVQTKYGCCCDVQTFVNRINFIVINSFIVKCDFKCLHMFTLQSCEVHLQDIHAKMCCAWKELIDGPCTFLVCLCTWALLYTVSIFGSHGWWQGQKCICKYRDWAFLLCGCCCFCLEKLLLIIQCTSAVILNLWTSNFMWLEIKIK